MPNSSDVTNADLASRSEATLKRTCVNQVIVSVSALGSMAVLLVQVLPPLMHGFR
jgi:hypothetical protein